MQQDRIKAISLMRVLAMTMIVAFHSLLFYTGTWWQYGGIVVPSWVKCSRFLDSIDLSMFVFISGFLYGWLYIFKDKYRDRQAFVVVKAKRLLVPYIVWGVLMILFQATDHSWEPLLTGISHLWFLLMLFWVFCMSLFLQRGSVANPSYCMMGLLLASVYSVWLLFHEYSSHHFFLCIESALSYSPSFLLGFFCAAKKMWLLPSKRFKLVLLVSVMLLAIYFFLCPQLPFTWNDLLIRFLSYTAIISLFIVMSSIKMPSKMFDIIVVFDKLSMGVYIFNQITINYLLMNTTAKEWLITNYQIGPFIIFIVSLTIPLCLSYVFNRYKWLSWTIGG